MDFFARQDVARRRTSLLVFFYVVAVILIVAGVYLAFTGIFIGIEAQQTGEADWNKLWNAEVFAWVAGVTLLLVAVGSLYKMAQLRQGGAAVATLLGGRPVIRNTPDPAEKRLVNVVEEIAIASGTPVPPVYVLDEEEGINAFAAGFTPSDAVIGVTRGAVERLSRDELQGVIAHEFSHILNGDMRLNIRLMGVLHGILVLALAGYVILRVFPYMMRSSGRGSSRGKGGALGVALAIALFGLLVMIIGYIGVFFGKLIKSAVSRQREYLADASAVQFTRQPSGLAGALKKIGGLTRGSRLRSAHAEEASHLFFSNGLRSALLGLMATHPPLVERIQRIDPSFDGDFRKYAAAPAAPRAAPGGAPRPALGAATAGLAAVPATPRARFEARPEEFVARVGAPRPEHLEYASQLVAALPKKLSRATKDPFGARAVVYCLLLNSEAAPRQIQLKQLEQHADEAVYRETLGLVPALEGMDPQARLPLVDMAIPSLRDLSRKHYDAFVENVKQLIAADGRIDLFEYVVGRIIARHLAPSFGRTRPPVVRYHAINPLADTCGALLSCLAYRGADDERAAQDAFARGAGRLRLKRPPVIAPKSACGLKTLDETLETLAHASPAIKKRVLEACTACVSADGKITVEEAELLRAVADSLDCPVPPFLRTPP
jgi:Zn-dependent protease with chaperone function